MDTMQHDNDGYHADDENDALNRNVASEVPLCGDVEKPTNDCWVLKEEVGVGKTRLMDLWAKPNGDYVRVDIGIGNCMQRNAETENWYSDNTQIKSIIPMQLGYTSR